MRYETTNTQAEVFFYKEEDHHEKKGRKKYLGVGHICIKHARETEKKQKNNLIKRIHSIVLAFSSRYGRYLAPRPWIVSSPLHRRRHRQIPRARKNIDQDEQ